MRNSLELWNADPLRNLTFSVHMYEVYQSPAPIQAYMQAFDDMDLPLVIGEFGPENNGQPVDSETVIAQAQQRGNGYLGWSWSGNGGSGAGLDMTNNFDAASLTTWGNRIINGTNGIRATSVLATVFGTPNNLAVSPTSLSFGSAAASSPVTVTANVSWTVTDDPSWLSVSPTARHQQRQLHGERHGQYRHGEPQRHGDGDRRWIYAHDPVTQASQPTANSLTRRADVVVIRIGRIHRQRYRDGERELDGHRQSDLVQGLADQRSNNGTSGERHGEYGHGPARAR